MRKILPLLGRILILLGLAIFAYFYASRLMDSIFAYRSPLRNSPPAPGGALGEPFYPAGGLRLDRRAAQ